ncbi:ETS1B protein, partial [Atrichornis clamosus]|nr:ETS1B protein [Atrichornis clamosus]
MSYYMDTTLGNAAPYPLAWPGVMKHGAVPCEDPWGTCGLPAPCCLPRPCCPLWDEPATQEVPTGLEHYGT